MVSWVYCSPLFSGIQVLCLNCSVSLVSFTTKYSWGTLSVSSLKSVYRRPARALHSKITWYKVSSFSMESLHMLGSLCKPITWKWISYPTMVSIWVLESSSTSETFPCTTLCPVNLMFNGYLPIHCLVNTDFTYPKYRFFSLLLISLITFISWYPIMMQQSQIFIEYIYKMKLGEYFVWLCWIAGCL